MLTNNNNDCYGQHTAISINNLSGTNRTGAIVAAALVPIAVLIAVIVGFGLFIRYFKVECYSVSCSYCDIISLYIM